MATGRNCCKGSRQSTLTLSPAALSLPGPVPRQAAPRPPSLHRLGLCREPRDQGQCYILPSRYRHESGAVPRQGINVGIRWSPPVLQPLLLVIYAIFCRACDDCVVDDAILRKSFPTPSPFTSLYFSSSIVYYCSVL